MYDKCKKYGDDMLVMDKPSPMHFSGFRKTRLIMVAYLELTACGESMDHEESIPSYNTVCSEYFLESEKELAEKAFIQRADAADPTLPSSYRRNLKNFLERE